MPKILTISPTHVPGKKKYAWNNFLSGGYIAIGMLRDFDLKGKSIDEVISIIKEEKFKDEARVIDDFTKFLSLEVGDYVAVNNTNDGLFGIGVISSDYKYQKNKHDNGAEDDDPYKYYYHYREVKWIYTDYLKRKDIINPGETSWIPYGKVGKLEYEVPPYILRLLAKVLSKLAIKINSLF